MPEQQNVNPGSQATREAPVSEQAQTFRPRRLLQADDPGTHHQRHPQDAQDARQI